MSGGGKKVLAGVLAIGCLAPVGLAGGALVLGLAMFADSDDADAAALCTSDSLSALGTGASDGGSPEVAGAIPEVDGFNDEAMQHAAVIVAVGKAEGIPTRGQLIALMTAMQESYLRNMEGGDRDSVGLFQQRPSVGWGTVEQIRTPTYSARAFYRGVDTPAGEHIPGLVDIDGWESLGLTQAAQRVQRSAYPNAYAKHEAKAREILSAVSGVDVTIDQNKAGAGLCAEDTGATGAASVATGTRADVLTVAETTMGLPYVFGGGGWDGPTRGGQDCSGLTTFAYQKALGIRLPREAKGQWAALRSYEVQPSEIQPGDLIFERWGRLGKDVSHVTMYIGDGKVIEASRGAKVTKHSDARLNSSAHVGIARVPDGYGK